MNIKLLKLEAFDSNYQIFIKKNMFKNIITNSDI